jgi:hypothetical protein
MICGEIDGKAQAIEPAADMQLRAVHQMTILKRCGCLNSMLGDR